MIPWVSKKKIPDFMLAMDLSGYRYVGRYLVAPVMAHPARLHPSSSRSSMTKHGRSRKPNQDISINKNIHHNYLNLPIVRIIQSCHCRDWIDLDLE